MAVVKLRTRRARAAEAGISRLRSAVLEADDGSSPAIVSRLVTLLDREMSSRSGWRFIMVEPVLYAQVVDHLARHSRRKLKAVQLWAHLFATLPPDSNEVQLGREELAQAVGLQPRTISEIMSELEAVGAIYRRREGRGVRYFVHPSLGTHLTGAVRDRAQGEAPKLRLVKPA
jgi:DNA-binding transcriptional ArsR family regulator